MTIKFKIYQYVNGNGNDVFMAKRQFLSFIYVTVDDGSYDGEAKRWRTRAACVNSLTEIADGVRNALVLRGQMAKANKLKLVLVDTVEV